jgi:hypothetical protein
MASSLEEPYSYYVVVVHTIEYVYMRILFEMKFNSVSIIAKKREKRKKKQNKYRFLCPSTLSS